MSGLDVDMLLARDRRAKISPENAVAEFKQMLGQADEISIIEDAMKQMGQIVRTLVTHSVGDSGFGRAMENIGLMRHEMIELEEPGVYDSFIRDLKERLLAGELGGDRRELWWRLKTAKLGLIDQNASEASKVTPEEASEVSARWHRVCMLPQSAKRTSSF